jgi:hypothetical protein
MINSIKQKYQPIGQTTVYSKFETEDIIKQQKESVTAGVWSSGLANLNTHFSSSYQTTTQKQYYVDVYNGLPTATDSLVQYSIAYGHRLGSGSDSQGELNDSPSRAIYSQFKQVLLEPSADSFVTYGSGSTDSIYVITFKRNRIKERLGVNTIEIPIQTISSRASNATGSVSVSGTVITLMDDSTINQNPTVGTYGRVYNLVSGSLVNGIWNASAPHYYGTVYPDFGCAIIDGNVLDQKLAFKTNVSSSSEGNNHFALFRAISGSGTVLDGNRGGDSNFAFYARNEEKITSTHFFVRVKNSNFNYSNNPSYVTGSNGDLSQTTFKDNPITYITTVGLYNDHNELLAVAKVSKPILKSFSKEALIQVKLDF